MRTPLQAWWKQEIVTLEELNSTLAGDEEGIKVLSKSIQNQFNGILASMNHKEVKLIIKELKQFQDELDELYLIFKSHVHFKKDIKKISIKLSKLIVDLSKEINTIRSSTNKFRSNRMPILKLLDELATSLQNSLRDVDIIFNDDIKHSRYFAKTILLEFHKVIMLATKPNGTANLISFMNNFILDLEWLQSKLDNDRRFRKDLNKLIVALKESSKKYVQFARVTADPKLRVEFLKNNVHRQMKLIFKDLEIQQNQLQEAINKMRSV